MVFFNFFFFIIETELMPKTLDGEQFARGFHDFTGAKNDLFQIGKETPGSGFKLSKMILCCPSAGNSVLHFKDGSGHGELHRARRPREGFGHSSSPSTLTEGGGGGGSHVSGVR